MNELFGNILVGIAALVILSPFIFVGLTLLDVLFHDIKQWFNTH